MQLLWNIAVLSTTMAVLGRVAELAYASALGADSRERLRVQIPPRPEVSRVAGPVALPDLSYLSIWQTILS